MNNIIDYIKKEAINAGYDEAYLDKYGVGFICGYEQGTKRIRAEIKLRMLLAGESIEDLKYVLNEKE